MGKKRSNVRTAFIVITAALCVLALLLGIYYHSQTNGNDVSITLPQTQSAVGSKPQNQLPEDPFLTVTRDNVLDILRSLIRPSGYHQAFSATTHWSEGDITSTIDLYEKNGVTKAVIRENNRDKHLLSDGKTLYLWYEKSETEVFRTDLADGTTLEDILGIPTYETVLNLPAETVLEAGYLMLGDADGTPCIYVACQLNDTEYMDRYWIDVENQVLYRADAQHAERQIYLIQQENLEILPHGETERDAVFTLPDGSSPFDQQLKGT